MASVKTSADGQIIRAEPKPGSELATFLDSMKPELARALPKHLSGDRMARVILTALRTVDGLATCTRPSFAGCILQLAQLGLEPNTPMNFAWLIPRRMKRGQDYVQECTVIIGYQGYLELARRAGVNAYAHAVREGDDFSFALGLNPTLVHVPSRDPHRVQKPITHVYAVAKTREFPGDPLFIVLDAAEVAARRARSAAAAKSFSPWNTDLEAMTLKTAIRAIWRWIPKSVEHASVEGLEATVDAGTAQSLAYDPSVTAALLKSGLDDAEDVISFDPETGEVAGEVKP